MGLVVLIIFDHDVNSYLKVVESVESALSTKRNPIESLKTWLKGLV